MGLWARKIKNDLEPWRVNWGRLIESAERSARALNRWAKFWQIADVSLGWSAAVLAAVAS